MVTGGRDLGMRDYRDRVRQHEALDRLHAEHGFTVVIEGGATGADDGARLFGRRIGIPVLTYPADWSLGRKAGPQRNARMIAEGKPDLVVAFPGGRGTADCVRQARAAGVRVVEVGEG